MSQHATVRAGMDAQPQCFTGQANRTHKLRLSCLRLACSSVSTQHLPWLSGRGSNRAGLNPSTQQGQAMSHKEDAGSVNTGGCLKGWAQVDVSSHCLHSRGKTQDKCQHSQKRIAREVRQRMLSVLFTVWFLLLSLHLLPWEWMTDSTQRPGSCLCRCRYRMNLHLWLNLAYLW